MMKTLIIILSLLTIAGVIWVWDIIAKDLGNGSIFHRCDKKDKKGGNGL